ncbi:MAG: phospholipid scramblase-related protein, partial [Pseudonocardiaceae bacterium]
MDGESLAKADWYPDPSGRHELRYFDGSAWTDHVATQGQQGSDSVIDVGKVPTVNRSSDKIQADVVKTGPSQVAAGGGTLFTEPVLVVNQKAKLIEIHSEYAIYDQKGSQIGAVREVGQSVLKKAVRLLGSVDQYLSHNLQIVDMTGMPVLALTRPAKLIKSKIFVKDAAGAEVGRILQENAVGKIHFGLHAGGVRIGTISAENWRAWNFNIQDAAGVEVARITKTWEGLAKTMFTTADNYVVHIHRPLAEPFRSLVVAAAVSID